MTFRQLLEVLNECAKKPDFPMDVPVCFIDQDGTQEIKSVLSDVQYLNDYVCVILLTNNNELIRRFPEATCYYKEE